jgi:hypothetical protein
LNVVFLVKCFWFLCVTFFEDLFLSSIEDVLFLHEDLIDDFEGSLFLYSSYSYWLVKDCFGQNLPKGEIVGFFVLATIW